MTSPSIAVEQSGQYRPHHRRDLYRTLVEFDEIWTSSLTTREQEQMIHLLIAKVGYNGRTGKVTTSFRSAGAMELCQGRIE